MLWLCSFSVERSHAMSRKLTVFAGWAMVASVLFPVDSVYANPEITVELPGGATMEFVWIEPGRFLMGTSQDEIDQRTFKYGAHFSHEGPQHEVTISRGFYLGKYELTQGQWTSVMGPWSFVQGVIGSANTATYIKRYDEGDPDDPAKYISWYEVQAFLHRLNQAAGDSLYRLPTEAEWEYACRAGTTTPWSFGDDLKQLPDYAWYYDLQIVQPVGMKLPNPWGLYDMHGNAYEWCQDWYGSYSSSAQVDPRGPASGSVRVIRAGGFGFHMIRQARSADRHYASPLVRWYGIGARLLMIGASPTAVTPTSWGKIKDDFR